MQPLDDDELWTLSYYRLSEITGSLFFGRVLRTLGDSAHCGDLTKHYADEAQHAWAWTDCLRRLDRTPLKLDRAYQDQYAQVIGAPANLMEVLAVTQVFEQRVIGQYARHLKRPGLAAPVRATLEAIMDDERWHLAWVRAALKDMRADYGEAGVARTLSRYHEADRAVFSSTVTDAEARLAHRFGPAAEEEGHACPH